MLWSVLYRGFCGHPSDDGQLGLRFGANGRLAPERFPVEEGGGLAIGLMRESVTPGAYSLAPGPRLEEHENRRVVRVGETEKHPVLETALRIAITNDRLGHEAELRPVFPILGQRAHGKPPADLPGLDESKG